VFGSSSNILENGGWIMWPIMGVSLVIWIKGLFMVHKIFCISRARKILSASFKQVYYDRISVETGQMHFDQLACKLLSSQRLSPAVFKCYFKELLISVIPPLERELQTIAVWVSVAPLLGLLGTVSGMVKTFEVITMFGAGNSTLIAEGISVALLTTEAGLIVAVSGLFLYNVIKKRKNNFQNQMCFDGEKMLSLLDRT